MQNSEFLRLFLLLAVFASVFLASQLLLRSTTERQARIRAVNKRLRMIREGSSSERIFSQLRKNDPLNDRGLGGPLRAASHRFTRLLMMASVPLSPLQCLLAMAIVTVSVLFASVAIAAFSGFSLRGGVVLLVTAVAITAGIVLPILLINILAERRRKRMEEQFPVALDIFVRALRSGHPVASAIELLTEEMEDPIGSEFGLVSDEVTYGANLTDALRAMAERWDLEDMRMFVVSLAVQIETGGNLAEILENLAGVIRARSAMYLKVRALSSEGRMTGWLLSILPVLTFILIFMSRPKFYLDVAHDPIFYIGFPIMIVWYLIGVFAIRSMVNLKV